jgi:DnaJ-class molecular chaperone
MPIYARKNEFGNLMVKVEIRIPDHLNDQELDLFRRLAALRAHSPGSGHRTESDRAYAE